MTQDFLDSYRSTQWQEKKNKILTRDNYTCAICGKHGDEHTLMHVHHLTYKNCKNGRAWDCPDEDLVTLCEDCHAKVHSGKPFKKASENFKYLKNEHELLKSIEVGCIIVYYTNEGINKHAFLVISLKQDGVESLKGIDFTDLDKTCEIPVTLDIDEIGLSKDGEYISLIEILPKENLLSKFLNYVAKKAGWSQLCNNNSGNYKSNIDTAFRPIEAMEYCYAISSVISLENFHSSETIAILQTCLGGSSSEESFEKLVPSLKIGIAAKAISLLDIIKSW